MPVTVVVVLLLVGFAIATAELGFRIGRRHRADTDDARNTEVRAVQASTLGLLALMLGFTLSMAADRFAARRLMIINEANAIRNVYQLAAVVPLPQGEQTRALLRAYLRERHEFGLAAGDDARAERASSRSEVLQQRIFAHAAEISRTNPDWELASMFPLAINEMIDHERVRRVASLTWMPATIHLLLFTLVAIAMGVTGYANGLSGRRTVLSVWLVPMLTAITCATVIDLDHPRAGLIRANDSAIVEVMQDLGR